VLKESILGEGGLFSWLRVVSIGDIEEAEPDQEPKNHGGYRSSKKNHSFRAHSNVIAVRAPGGDRRDSSSKGGNPLGDLGGLNWELG